MQPLLALLPILVFVALLLGLRLSAATAGLVSAAACLAIAYLAFGYPLGSIDLLGPLLEAGFTAISILWIILPALAIHEYQTRTGATATLAAWLSSVSAKPQLAALLIAWFFALFLEGAAGFGTPIALAAPLLVAVGFTPVRALAMALLGHAAGVSFGAVGTPIVPLLNAAPLDPYVLSILIVALHAVLGLLLPAIVFRMARPAERSERANWYWVPVAAALFFVPAAALAWFLGPELPTLGGALLGLVLFAAVVRRERAAAAGAPPVPAMEVGKAALPYLLVLVGVLLTRMIQPVAGMLRSADLTWRLDAFGGSVAPLYHPGTMLMAGLVVAALVSRPLARRELRPALVAAAARLAPVGLALVAVLVLARLMVHSGMIETLAGSAASMAGPHWPAASPLVGALGSFVTGSATTSNILFADFHVAVSAAGGFSPLLPLAGQGFGAAIGNIVAPHNIIAGAATVGLIGREAATLRQTIPVCLVYALLGGAILLLIGPAW